MAIPLKSRAEAPPGRGGPSRYEEFTAGHPVVACTWEGRGGWTRDLTLFPDGGVDLVWTGEALLSVAAGETILRSSLESDRINVGLRLRPGAAGAVLGAPAHRLQGRSVRLADLWGKTATRVETRLARAREPARRRAILEALVADRLAGRAGPDPAVLKAVDDLAAPGASVEAAARTAGLSTRELHRRFVAEVGLGPKTLQRVLRFGDLIRRLGDLSAGRTRLAELALDLGYADQAHLSRECRRIGAATPLGLVRRWAR